MKTPLPYFYYLLSLLMPLWAEPEDVSAHLKEVLQTASVPGLAVAAIHEGDLRMIGAAGIRKQGDEAKVTLEDQFHLGSCTKAMTAVLAARLVDLGKVSWETTLAEGFPKMTLHPDHRTTTLKQLLTNMGGLAGDIPPPIWKTLWSNTGTPQEQRLYLTREMLAIPPTTPPGTANVYSNAGFAIAGAMLEGIMKTPYEELMARHVFEPLGLTTAGFRAPATNGKVDQPYGHQITPKGPVPVDPEPAGDNPRGIAPAGAVHCSVRDFVTYAAFHLDAESQNLLQEDQHRKLRTPPPGQTYAMGWIANEREWAGGTAYTHMGSNTMFTAIMWVVPEKDLAVVAVCNAGGPEAFQVCDQAIATLIKKTISP